MTNQTPQLLRLGLTAIAAAIALFSTPLLAQSTTVPDSNTAPPTAAPAPTTPSVPTTTEPTTAPEAQDLVTPTEQTAAPASSSTSVRRTSATRTTRPAHAATAVVKAPSKPAAVHAATTVPPPAVATPAVEPSAAPPTLAQPQEAAKPSQALGSFDPLAAAGALGIVALAVGGVALNRRRRRRLAEEEEEAAWQEDNYEPAEHQPILAEAPVEPAAVTAPAATAPAANDERTLPEGFDLSRFGRHVQAAYRGPTEDNPSLSLRHRLRRAAAMDQAERRAGGAAPETSPPEPARETEPAAPVEAQRQNAVPVGGSFMFTRAKARPAPTPERQH
jgi:hypothetical protein